MSTHLPFAALGALLLLAASASAQFVIGTSPGVFAPSFRNEGNTTWFGWASGTFDAAVDNELVDNPPVTIGAGGLDGTLNQIGTDDYLASSNNIYTAGFDPAPFTLTVPTSGVVGTGFTTIIIQGRSANFGPTPVSYPASSFAFPTVGGDAPEIVSGTNSAGQAQFWVKYEIPGNAASYTVNFALAGSNISVAQMTVDTQWRSSGYAPDSAQAVPEPSAMALGLLGVAGFAPRRRRTA